ncbi:hypothetical protein G7054_g198 [Neopestalotiopsis clavispora]|nr:hypothetical protein G7054_g198 [Neopestalotiopsis clavispora]
MPLFSRKEEVVEPEPVVHEEPKRSHGLFGSRRERSPSPTSTVATSTTSNSHHSSGTKSSYHTTRTTQHHGAGSGGGGGIFRRSTDASSVASSTTTGRRSLLSRSFGHGNNVEMDPSIVAAREHVLNAETAEREARPRPRVRPPPGPRGPQRGQAPRARAAEEAKRAKIKQYHAREVSKRGKQLGRHDL